jgi:hypothetical protein
MPLVEPVVRILPAVPTLPSGWGSLGRTLLAARYCKLLRTLPVEVNSSAKVPGGNGVVSG